MTDSDTNPFASPRPETHQVESTALPTSGVGENFEVSDLAVVEEISPPWNGRVLTDWHKMWAHLSRYWVYVIPTVCIGYVAYVHVTRVPLNWQSLTFMQLMFATLIVAWPALILSSHLMVPFWFEDRYLTRKLQREVRSRPDSYTPAPRSAGCQFVAIVPRENWQLRRSQIMDDVALMRIDPYGSTIYVEGDQRRWRIPSAALTKCSVERIFKGWTEIWLLRLNFQSTTGPQELFLRMGDADAFANPTNNGRKRNAEKYWTRIMLLHQQRSKPKGSSKIDSAR